MAQGVYQLLRSTLERQRPQQLPLRHGLRCPGDEAIPQTAREAVLPLRQTSQAERAEDEPVGPRQAQGLVTAQGGGGMSGSPRRHSASTTASSIAWPAPWPRLGVIGWAASPRGIRLPSPQFQIGSRWRMSLRRIASSGVASRRAWIGGCHPLNSRRRVARDCPGSSRTPGGMLRVVNQFRPASRSARCRSAGQDPSSPRPPEAPDENPPE